MIHFRALGSIEFRELEARAADALLAQPKRLALLAYLILAAPRGFQRRESLVSLLWPDRPTQRGRGALRNALHFLRQHLGKEVIRSRADEVGVDRALVWCDAITFDESLVGRRPAVALELYRGDLLPGLGSSGSPGFARWLEKERDDFRSRAADAAWALAEAEEELRNWISAADYARHAASLSEDQETAIRRLMRLLVRVGDGVAAIREYESFAARVRGEYGIAPSPETKALAEAIHRGSSVSVVARSGPGSEAGHPADPPSSPAVHGGRSALLAREHRGKIAVLPFLQTGSGPKYEYVASGLAQAIIASLSRLSHVLVLARTSVDRFGTGEDPRTLGPMAEQLGVETIVHGSLGLAAGRLSVAAQLVDARSRAPLWSCFYERRPQELLYVQSELVLGILEVLGVALSPQEEERVARRPTANPEAYEQYLKGRFRTDRRSKRDLEAAILHFEAALRLDPDFALAFSGLAGAYVMLHNAAGVRSAEVRVRAREAARAALRADPDLGEAYATLGLVSIVELDWHRAEVELRRAIELSPGYATAHHWYSGLLGIILRRFEQSAAEMELARELDPLSPIIQSDTGLILLHSGRSAEAIRQFHKALELEPTFWRAHYDLGVALTVAGDREGAVHHLRQAWRLGGYGADPEGAAAAESGTTDWRVTLERKLEELQTASHSRGVRGVEGALVSVLLGREDEALEWLRVALDEGAWTVAMMYYPAFAAFQGRPEFTALLETAGLGGVADLRR